MRHFIRSVKYLLMLVVIFVVVTLFMNFAGSLDLSLEEQFALFMANNGVMKIIFLVVLSAVYPLFGFIKRDVEGDIVENYDQIIVAMETSGFSLKEKRDGELKFTANTIFRRLAFLFEDTITVTQRGDKIHIEGVRRGVVYIVYCLDGFIQNSKTLKQEE